MRAHRRRFVVALAVLVAVGWVVPAEAHASAAKYVPAPQEPDTCWRGPGRTLYFSGAGETNRLTISAASAAAGLSFPYEGPCSGAVWRAGAVVINDGAADIRPFGCRSIRPRAVVCPDSEYIEIYLGDQKDQLILEALPRLSVFDFNPGAGFVKAYVDGGPGDDVLRVANGARDTVVCGLGIDTVQADAVDAVGPSCETVTRV